MSESLFAIIAYDNPGSEALRTEHHETHIAHFRAHAAKIAVAGPLMGEVPGSLVVIRAESAADARAFIEADPFYPAGVWARVEVAAFKAGIGDWVAG